MAEEKMYTVTEFNIYCNKAFLAKAATNYFEALLQSSNNSVEESLLEVIPDVISLDQNSTLCKCPDLEEVKRDVWALNGNSAPGPDGFTGSFFTSCWDIVGTDTSARRPYWRQ
ncbi:hypothetical protein Taro_031798 [Colocasia esculenta]|uniref:Uncharacterized protein n=1 Tax=Colocasia esculenta TaxID=4460 RepID=A0A843VPT0_COLES|nr:hypothetical protein [Colocasia esculenta]